MARLLVVGGSDAGISAAFRARELDPSVEVTVMLADAHPNYSICGLPYFLSGDVPDWRSLAHRGATELERLGLELLSENVARAIDAGAKRVVVTDAKGEERTLGYDKLIVSTGALPISPPIPGLDLPAVHVLHTMGDAFAVQKAIGRRATESAVVVGAGYIGLEMTEALAARGLKVTVVEQLPEVLPTVDPVLGARVREELISHGVTVATATRVEAIHEEGPGLVVRGSPDLEQSAELVLVVVGTTR